MLSSAPVFSGTIAGHVLTAGPGTYFTDYQGNTYALQGSVTLSDAGGLPEYMFFGVEGVDLSDQDSGIKIVSNDSSWNNNGWPGVTLDKYFFKKEHIWDTGTGGMFTADVEVSLSNGRSFPAVINPDMPFEGGVINEEGSLFGSASNPMAMSVINLKVYAIVNKAEAIFVNFDPTMSPWDYNNSLFKGRLSDASYDNLNFSLAEIGTLSIVVPKPLAMLSNPDASVTQSRIQYDRINRVFFVLFNVTNNSTEPMIGPAHLLIKNSSLPVLNADGTNSDGTPYITFLTEGETLDPGTTLVGIRANFPRKRVRLTFQTGVESMLPVQPQLCDISGTATLNNTAPATGYKIRIYNDQFGGVDKVFDVDLSGTYTAPGVPCGASTLYVYDPSDNYLGRKITDLPADPNIDLYQWNIFVQGPDCMTPARVSFASIIRYKVVDLDENGQGTIATVGEEMFYSISVENDLGFNIGAFSKVTLGDSSSSYQANSQCGQLDVNASSYTMNFSNFDCLCQGQGEEIWVCAKSGCSDPKYIFKNNDKTYYLFPGEPGEIACTQVPTGNYSLEISGTGSDSCLFATLYDAEYVNLTNQVQDPNCTPGSEISNGMRCDYKGFFLNACNGDCCVEPHYDADYGNNVGVELIKWIAMYDADGNGEEERVQFVMISECCFLWDECGSCDQGEYFY